MKQNTETWLNWRLNGIGSSDAPIIMGASKYSNLRELGLIKRRIKKGETTNFAMQRGKDLEPTIRAYFELELDLPFPETLWEHDQFPWLRASLDGYNKCYQNKKTIMELKAPCVADHELAIAGKVPDQYFWQIQHQFAVSGAEQCIYGSYHPDYYPKGARVMAYPDTDAISKLAQREVWFWGLIQKNLDPALYDPWRLKCECAKKSFYGTLEETLGVIEKQKSNVPLYPFRCNAFCGYYHIATRNMSKRSKNIVEALVA